jgi:hypothetical protein
VGRRTLLEVREGEAVSGQVIQFPRRQVQEVPLTYKQLAAELKVSKRFLQLRHAEGMPSAGLDYAGRRTFLRSQVTPWLDARQERLGRTMDAARSPLHREATS